MTTNSIPMGDAISWGWERFRENAALLVVAHIVAYFIPSFVRYVGTLFAMNVLVEWIVDAAAGLATLTFQLGIINLCLRIHDGKAVKFDHLVDQVDRLGWYFLAVWLLVIAAGLGFLLFIVPGVIIIVRLVFLGQVLVDERVNTLDAFQRSWDITRGYGFDLFLFGLLLLGINLLGFLLLGVGYFVSGPVTMLASVYVFRLLKSRHDAAAGTPPTPATP